MNNLAISGGPKANTLKNYNTNPWPIIEKQDIDAVVGALEKNDLFGVNND